MPTSELQKQITKLRRDKKILWLGILFFVLVVLWILVGIFATSRTSSIDPELRELARPFVPRLESKVFEEILTKKVFDDGELSYFPIYIFDKNSSADGGVLINIVRDPLISNGNSAFSDSDFLPVETEIILDESIGEWAMCFSTCCAASNHVNLM